MPILSTKRQQQNDRIIIVLFVCGVSIYSIYQASVYLDFYNLDVATVDSNTAVNNLWNSSRSAGTFSNFDVATEDNNTAVNHLWNSSRSAGTNKTRTSKKPKRNGYGLPTLEELTKVNYSCPEGTEFFENIVLPENITHANRKIPKVVHLTAKTRCLTPDVKKHILKWKFPEHSLYFHDDIATYRLLQYAVNDANGYELVRGLSKQLLCISSGATMSDMWRYTLLYHYGGIYTDLDNAPGSWYKVDYINPETDSFYFVEQIGTMSQFYMVSSKHHPILLYMLSSGVSRLYDTINGNVMQNFPAQLTGPGAVKVGMIFFLRAAGMESDGYEPEGVYYGQLSANYTSTLLPWFGKDLHPATLDEYPTKTELYNRSVTVFGKKEDSKEYINRKGMPDIGRSWKAMNMSDYHVRPPRTNRISCPQHVARMLNETNSPGSFYFGKTRIKDLLPKYEFSDEKEHYIDTNTGELLMPWNDEIKEQFESEYEIPE